LQKTYKQMMFAHILSNALHLIAVEFVLVDFQKHIALDLIANLDTIAANLTILLAFLDYNSTKHVLFKKAVMMDVLWDSLVVHRVFVLECIHSLLELYVMLVINAKLDNSVPFQTTL